MSMAVFYSNLNAMSKTINVSLATIFLDWSTSITYIHGPWRTLLQPLTIIVYKGCPLAFKSLPSFDMPIARTTKLYIGSLYSLEHSVVSSC